MNPVAEVRKLRNHGRAVSTQQWQATDLPAEQREGRQAEDLLTRRVRAVP
jgi:hypothetical protein